MLINQIDNIVKSCSFKNFLYDIEFLIESNRFKDKHFLYLQMRVPERDTGLSIKVNTFRPIYEGQFEDKEQVIEFLIYMINYALMHEVYETFHIDGKRYKDPHANENQTT